MERQVLKPEGVAVPKVPLSSAVVTGDWLLTSGQVPFDEEGKLVSEDFAPQARQAFENLGRCLAAGGCDFSDVVKVTAYLAHFEDDFETYNDLYREYFAEPYPVRTTVQTPLVGFRLELDAMVRIP